MGVCAGTLSPLYLHYISPYLPYISLCAQALQALGQLPKQARAVSALQQELAGALPIYHPLGPEQELAGLPQPYNPTPNPTPTANP